MVHAEVAQGRTKEHRGQLAVEEFLLVELMAGALHQFELFDEAVVLVTQVIASLIGVELLDDLDFGPLVAVARGCLLYTSPSPRD